MFSTRWMVSGEAFSGLVGCKNADQGNQWISDKIKDSFDLGNNAYCVLGLVMTVSDDPL